ncbi:MAG: phosphoglycerate dehydrogenase [Actinomycetota bacterium]|nr:phosphoglycerate dehydrogenase [Actinomycetota bacterium]
MRVLVAERIGDPGVELLRGAGLDVELGTGWEREELERRIDAFEGLLVRSATRVDAGLLARAGRLRAVGRAGVGVDNVDVAAATKRGIVVANAPAANVVTAAEHTLALLLALARNVPQAHAALVAGRWERSRFSGVELQGKVLGVLGFGRIGQLVAERARGFGMRVVAFDPLVAAERFRELGAERAEDADAVYAVADFLTLHLPATAETEGVLDAAAFARMKRGVRILNVARGSLIVDEALREALEAGQVAGAALDVFRTEPVTDHPLFGRPEVVVTPHLGASTAEATDRAGLQAAEQVVAALTGGTVTTAVNLPAVATADLELLGPFRPLCHRLGRLAAGLAGRVDRVEVEVAGRIGERDTRPLAVAVLLGALGGQTEEEVNEVNAPAIAEERGIVVTETRTTTARDFTDLVRVTVGGERVAGTTIGRRHRPHLLEAWGQRFNLELEGHLTLFRYRDVPGMIGRIGTLLGAEGINIGTAAVGHGPEEGEGSGVAVMAVSSDRPVPHSLVGEIAALEGFEAARTIQLRSLDEEAHG